MSTQTKVIPYSFGSKEYKDLKNHLLSSEPLNPDKEIKKFNEAVTRRGYNFFSDESLNDWKQQYGHVSNSDLQTWATGDTLLFMHSVRTPANPAHDQNRLLFTSQFNSDEANVKAHILDKTNEAFGRNNVPGRDTAYESRTLNMGQITTKHQGFEHKTFLDLMKAKWSALGYYKDAEYKEKFLRDYAIALMK